MTLSTYTSDRSAAEMPSDGGPRNATAATLGLARVEGLRLLCHPAVLIATALLLAVWLVPWFTGSMDRFPELFQDDAKLHVDLLLLASGGMIAANLAVLRAHRHGADIFYDVVPFPVWRRTVAHLLAVLALAGAAGLLTVARMVQLAVQPGAVGRPNMLILAAGPIMVLLFGVLGVLLGVLVRSAVVVPLIMAVLVFYAMFGLYTMIPSGLVRLLPTYTGESLIEPQIPELLGRPATAHLGYLLGLVMLVAAASLLRAGAPRPAVVAGLCVALVVTIGTGAVQAAGPSAALTARRMEAEYRPAAMQHCRTESTVTYCAFGVYGARVEEWSRVVDGIRRRVPPAAADAPFAVRQRIVTPRSVDSDWGSFGFQTAAAVGAWRADDRDAGTPDPISVGTEWGANGDASVEAAFAAHVAYRMVKGTSPTQENNLVCGASGTILVWLAGQATPGTRTSMLAFQNNWGNRTDSFAPAPLGGSVNVGRREADLGYALLQQPADQIAAVLDRSWPELTAPKTTVERAAEILGVKAAAPLEKVPAGEESTLGDCG